jgi:hypothetical protein
MDKKTTKRITPTKGVKIIINREFVGTQSIDDAFVPIIYDDIKKRLDTKCTFDF